MAATIQLTTANDMKQLGTILSVWAHPDDETYTSGGIMAAAAQNGQQVVCITATKGEAGIQDTSRWPASSLGETRSAELERALRILGVTKHHWLGCSDGACAQTVADKGIRWVQEYIDFYKPDTILTFGPDGITGHEDHRAVSTWASQAARTSGLPLSVYYVVERQDAYEQCLKDADKQLNIYFNIEKPVVKARHECDIYFELTPELCDLKRRALAAMPSQTEALLRQFPPDTFGLAFGTEAFMKAK